MKSLLPKLLEAKKHMKAVPKNGFNAFNKYKYVTEIDVLKAIDDALQEQGLIHWISVDTSNVYTREYRDATYSCASVMATLTIADTATGETIETKMPGYSEDKNGDKAAYKAITGATKYAYLKLFGIGTTDDPENDSQAQKPNSRSKTVPIKPDAEAQEALKELIALGVANQIDSPTFQEATGYASTDSIKNDAFALADAKDKLVDWLMKRGKQYA